MIPVKRLEIVVDAPHSRHVTRLLESHGLTGWTLLRNVTGSGERGRQLADELTGVSSNHLILCACQPEVFETLMEELRALLVRTGGMCLISDAQWLRH